MSAPAIVFTAGMLESKFWVAGLPFPPFMALFMVLFTNALGDKSPYHTSGDLCGVVGEL